MNSVLAVLTLDFHPDPGGVQQYLFEIAQRLSQNYSVFVLTPVDEDPSVLKEFQTIKIAADRIFRSSRVLRSIRPDRVLLGHAHPRLMLITLLARFSTYSTIANGNDFLAAQHAWHRVFFNYFLNRSRPLIAHSKHTAGRLTQLGFDVPVVIHPGVDPNRFTPSQSPRFETPNILTVGRLVPRKGIDTALRAMPVVLEEFPEVVYRIAGDGPDRPRLEKLSVDLGIRDAVHFLGRVDRETLPDQYRSADIYVMPAREEGASLEGFGLVYLEASASGLPVIAGRSGGAVEAVQDGITGILVEPNDPKSLAASILDLFSNPDKRKRMGSAGRRWVETEMNWDRTAAELAGAIH